MKSTNTYQYITNNSHQELIDYLKQENKQLTDQLKELNNLLQLNKKALKIMTPQNNEEQNKALLMVLKNLQEENAKLNSQIEKLINERNQAQNQVLINQQITEEAQRHEKELIVSLQNKITTLQNNLSKAESQLCKLEFLKPEFDEQSGILIKYKQITDTNKINKEFHDQIETLNDLLILQIKKNKKIEAQKRQLQGLNLKLITNLISIKNAALISNGNKVILQQQQQMDPQPNQLIKFQQNILYAMKKDENIYSSESEGLSSVDNSPLASPLPVKLENCKPQQESQKIKNAQDIPKLNLSQAIIIQELNAKRQTQQAQDMRKATDANLLDKLKQYDQALEGLKKNYQREMTLNKTLETTNNELERHCENLESQIQILINSNLRYQEKQQKINKQYHFLQQFYLNKKDQVTTTQSHNHRFSQSPTELSQEIVLDTSFIDANEAILSNEQEFKNIQYQMMQQQQIQQQLLQQQNFCQFYFANNVEDAQRFLLGLAEQMYSGLSEKIELIIQGQSKGRRENDNRIRSLSDIVEQQNRVQYIQQQ
ncbi:unnamed protein product (macronuclear) [Paramecium tetraurelia]|uniref:Uncharacterized protein n=1 Tax=Paramecium tetraurelia TaxID=5888 RepID=A0ED51_PARTE|nr:uncharacterized protein GSPATT00004087001 [Paramecium tetraurelia]CAK93218.1 unnamed protein product [Paramecium tetraurelia]|eukprot:XP_001460615.1 hypothetical protein (macronuclear) [Paramecium tetraurelia strain d4-2]